MNVWHGSSSSRHIRKMPLQSLCEGPTPSMRYRLMSLSTRDKGRHGHHTAYMSTMAGATVSLASWHMPLSCRSLMPSS